MSLLSSECLPAGPATNFLANCHRYLQQLSGMGVLVGDFYLLLGHTFEASPLPKEIGTGVPRQCYANAAALAVEHGLTYCEGFAMRPGLFPLHHAWCVDKAGKVVDPTWPFDPRNEYLGVALSEKFLLETCEQSGHWGIFSEHIPLHVVQSPPAAFIHRDWIPSQDRQAKFATLIAQHTHRK